MNLDLHLDGIRLDSGRLASCIEGGDLDASVAGCPGWDLRKLGVHTGFIHRWATRAVQTGAPPQRGDVRTPRVDADSEELGAWIRLGAGVLVDVLANTPTDHDTWHPFPAEQKAHVWWRRQAMETMIHRWDAEMTVDGSSDLDTAVAVDGLAEYFEMLLPGTLTREQRSSPGSTLIVRCADAPTDRNSEWTMRGELGEYRMTAGPGDGGLETEAPGRATLEGRTDTLLLTLMGRSDADGLTVGGDRSVVDEWLSLPGL